MKKKLQNFFKYGVKLTFSILILYILFSKLDLAKLFRNTQEFSLFTLIWIFLIFLFNQTIQFFRFKSMCSILTKRPHLKEISAAFFSGFTLKFLVPGGYGDLGKMIFIHDKVKPRVNIFLLEKTSTVLLTLFGGSITLAFLFNQYLLLLIALLPLVIFFSLNKIKNVTFLKKYILNDVQMQKKILVYVGYTLLLYLTISLQYWFMANNFSAEVFLISMGQLKTIGLFYCLVVILLSANLLPVTIGGLGIRESIGFYLFPLIGLSAEDGVLLPLMVFLLNSGVPAIVGAFFAFFSPKYLMNKK